MPDFDEELLTAYLDGELPDEERSRVERWLEEQPEGRQLLEELRSIQTGLERLPRERLPREFADDVLRQAERAILTSRDGPAATADGRGAAALLQADRTGPFDGEQAAAWSWRRLRRPIVWASLTLAAGLLVMFLDRDRLPPAAHRQVAQVPAEAPAMPRGEIGAAVADEPRNEPMLRRNAAPEGAASAAPARPASAVEAGNERPPPPAPAPRGAPESQSGRFGARMSGAKARGTETSNEALEEVDRESFGASDARKRAALGAQLQRRATIAAGQTLVVWCDVSPDKKYNERFRQLLVSNGIQWNEEEYESMDAGLLSEGAPDVAEKTGEADKKRTEPATGPAARKPGAGGENTDLFLRSNAQHARRLLEAGQAALESKAELVFVEASGPQIEALLDELDRDDDVFKAVDVEPAAEVPSQQSFERYRRGNTYFSRLTKQRAAEQSKKETEQGEASGLAPRGGETLGGKAGTPAPKSTGETAAAEKSAPRGRPAATKGEALGLKTEEETAEKKQKVPGGVAYRLNRGLGQFAPARENAKLDETTSAPASGEEGRLQVLFVLHPVEDTDPAEPADEKKDKNDD